MSDTTGSSSDSSLEIFKENVTGFLEQAFIATVILAVIAFMFYLGFLPQNVQNTLPLLLMVFLSAYTWILRAKIDQSQPEELRIYILQWLILCSVVIIGTVIAIVLYPYSNFGIS